MRFYGLFFTIFWHHIISDKDEAQHFKNFVKIRVKSKYITGFSQIPRYCRKRTVSLRVFASSLNTLYTAKSAQFHSTVLLTTISLTPRFCRKHKVWLRFFAENAQKTIQTHTVTKTALNLTPRLGRQRSAMLRAFGENGKWLKTLNIWATLKNIFENVGCSAFCIY